MKRGTRDLVVPALLLAAVALSALPPLPISSPAKALPALLFIVAVVVHPPLKLRTTWLSWGLLWTFVVLVFVSIARSIESGSLYSDNVSDIGKSNAILLALTFVSLTLFLTSALLTPLEETEIGRRRLCACMSAPAFVALNFAMYLAGYRFPTADAELVQHRGTATMLGALGIHHTRVSMPLTPGVNGNGIVTGLSLVITALLATRTHGRLRVLVIALSAVEVVVLLLADSRGPAVCAVLAIAGLLVLTGRSARNLTAVAGLVALMPLVALAAIRVVSYFGGASALERGGTNANDATGRVQVWRIVWDYFKHVHLADLYGYGYYGQVASGVSYRYQYLFATFPHPALSGPQSVMFQTVFDIGWVGLLALILLFAVSIATATGQLRSTGSVTARVAAAGLVYLALIGGLENVPSVYIAYVLAAFLILVVVAIRDDPHPVASPLSVLEQQPVS